MLSEAIKTLADLGKKAAGPEMLQLWKSDHRRIIFNHATGDLKEYSEPMPARRHIAETKDDFVRIIQTLNSRPAIPREEDEGIAGNAVVWLNSHEAVAVLNDHTYRDDVVVWPLPWSPQAILLSQWESQKTVFEPAVLIKAIRLELGLPNHPLIAGMSAVDWQVTNSTASRTERTKESLGKNIHAEIAGVSELSETTTVAVPLYTHGIASRADVACHVEIDPQRGQIGLIPPPGEMDLQFEMAMVEIQAALTKALGEDIPVYQGSPDGESQSVRCEVD